MSGKLPSLAIKKELPRSRSMSGNVIERTRECSRSPPIQMEEIDSVKQELEAVKTLASQLRENLSWSEGILEGMNSEDSPRTRTLGNTCAILRNTGIILDRLHEDREERTIQQGITRTKIDNLLSDVENYCQQLSDEHDVVSDRVDSLKFMSDEMHQRISRMEKNQQRILHLLEQLVDQ